MVPILQLLLNTISLSLLYVKHWTVGNNDHYNNKNNAHFHNIRKRSKNNSALDKTLSQSCMPMIDQTSFSQAKFIWTLKHMDFILVNMTHSLTKFTAHKIRARAWARAWAWLSENILHRLSRFIHRIHHHLHYNRRFDAELSFAIMSMWARVGGESEREGADEKVTNRAKTGNSSSLYNGVELDTLLHVGCIEDISPIRQPINPMNCNCCLIFRIAHLTTDKLSASCKSLVPIFLF